MSLFVDLCGAIDYGDWLPIRWACVRVLPQEKLVVHCWLIGLNKLNLLSWLLLLAYLSGK